MTYETFIKRLKILVILILIIWALLLLTIADEISHFYINN